MIIAKIAITTTNNSSMPVESIGIRRRPGLHLCAHTTYRQVRAGTLPSQRLKRPGQRGVSGVGAVVLKSGKVFRITVILVSGVPPNPIADADGEPGHGREEAQREGLGRLELRLRGVQASAQ